ncbi:MAG TPA: gephyrin-like molybdotransferase Glp [Terriglobia bacterium]|nr:gephyrin-like molybdotransferase Glp [Terriglobia bacterium]
MSSAVLSYGEAASVVDSHARQFALRPRPVERVDLALAAGRVLAEPVRADRDQPPFPRSTRDGYACRAADAATHGFLLVAGTVRAGEVPAGPLPPGATWEIMTGAPVPEGADAVIMLEHVETDGCRIRLSSGRSVRPEDNIVARGGEAREGDVVLASGTRLAAPHIAAAASCGYPILQVFARPRVAILTTGDELVPVAEQPGPGQIRNSNAPMLAAMVTAAGGKPMILPRAADSAEALDVAIDQAANADLLLVSGGVSAGRYDLVEDAMTRAGAEFHFSGVRIQPGKPAVFGQVPRGGGDAPRIQPFFGLPGNPISSAATFLLFVAPVLAAQAGAMTPVPRFALVRLAKDCNGKPGLTRFVPAHCDFNPPPGEPPTVAAVPWQGSGDLTAFAQSNCFLVVPEGPDGLHAGEIVRILMH